MDVASSKRTAEELGIAESLAWNGRRNFLRMTSGLAIIPQTLIGH
jgi:hypothetical protein